MKANKWKMMMMAVTMVALTACSNGNGGGGTEPNAPADPVNESATNETGEVNGTEEQPVVDMDGRVIRISAWWDLTPAGESVGDIERLEKIAELEEKYNVTFEFVNVPFEEYMPMFTSTMLTGEPFADIVLMETKSAWNVIQKGQLMKLDDFTTASSNLNNGADLLYKTPALGGEHYGFNTPSTGGDGLHYNRDLFKQLGLPDLQEVYESGEWNWNKFLEIAKQATRDTDNDGTPDVFGFSGWSIDILRHFTAANGGKFIDEENGTQLLSDPKTIEAAEFINRLYNVENVVKNKTGDRMEYNEFNTFKDGDVAMFPAPIWAIGDITFDIGVVPFPNGPQGSSDYTYADTSSSAYFIPTGTADAEIIYSIFEQSFDTPTQMEEFPSQEYLEGMYTHEEDIAMHREHITGTGRTFLEDAYPEYPISDFVTDIIVNNQSVTATSEKYRPEAEASIARLGE